MRFFLFSLLGRTQQWGKAQITPFQLKNYSGKCFFHTCQIIWYEKIYIRANKTVQSSKEKDQKVNISKAGQELGMEEGKKIII